MKSLFLRMMCIAIALLIFCGMPTLAQDEPNTDVDNSLLAKKFFVGMAVKLEAPPEALKEAKLTQEAVKQTVERALKAQGIRVVEVGNDRQDMAMIVRMSMKSDGGQVVGSCEINVIVVVEDPKSGNKKPRMAFDSFGNHPGRSAKEVGGLLFKALNKDLGMFATVYKKHNP